MEICWNVSSFLFWGVSKKIWGVSVFLKTSFSWGVSFFYLGISAKCLRRFFFKKLFLVEVVPLFWCVSAKMLRYFFRIPQNLWCISAFLKTLFSWSVSFNIWRSYRFLEELPFLLKNFKNFNKFPLVLELYLG